MAILQNKLKGTTVAPLFVADTEKDEKGNFVFTPFDFRELDPSLFPNKPHARNNDVQYMIDNERYELHFFFSYFDLFYFPELEQSIH